MPVATIQTVATAPPYTVTLTDDLGHQWLADEPPDAGGANAGPSAVMGASMSLFGSARAQYHLRQSLIFLDVHFLNKPEVMIALADWTQQLKPRS